MLHHHLHHLQDIIQAAAERAIKAVAEVLTTHRALTVHVLVPVLHVHVPALVPVQEAAVQDVQLRTSIRLVLSLNSLQ